MKKNDLIGKVFNRLTVIDYAPNDSSNKTRWTCKCQCGTIKICYAIKLTSGELFSCGCYHRDNLGKLHTIHGQSGYNITAEYRAWQNLKRRCYDINDKRYMDYGGRGIKVCDRWLGEGGFNNFFSDMGSRPSKYHSVDRYPNNNGDYEPSNCRWGTDEQQRRNKRNNVWFEHNGTKMILKDWAREFKTNDNSIRQFISRGRTFEWVFNYYTTKNKNAA